MKALRILVLCSFGAACAWTTGDTSYQVLREQPFTRVADKALLGDLFLPEGPGLRPAMVVVHGGGWTNRSGDMEGISRQLAKAGFVVFNTRYRLAPEYHHPAQLNDVNAALEWLYANAERYRIDPARIGGWGYSAGAHLILLAGLTRDRPPYLNSIVAGGTPAKLTAWPRSPLVTDLIGKPMKDAPQAWRDASPVNHVRADSPPVFLYHGQWDALVEVEQMDFMRQALTEHGVTVETYTVPLLGHIGSYFLGGAAERRGIEFALAARRATISKATD